eukprot:TRINITY_DN20219_c0_g1_i1.p1 TRINITY_DN20219_c0_g1~~TRINITY_DN20219_c0_g1_i1.p1  ORF type:complete len:270 (-),score=41.48 TRINITY_DN20219_c0_g1_i1:173-982(-)
MHWFAALRGQSANLSSIAMRFMSTVKIESVPHGTAVRRMMDDEPTMSQMKEAYRFFKGPCNFVTSVANKQQLTDVFHQHDLPQIAIAGRSNVGKSSLINALLGQKKMAIVSKTPGRTQMINFFNLSNQLMLVDLPGYGFARAPTQLAYKWNMMTSHYLSTPSRLMRLFLLIDSRVGLKELDKDFLHFLASHSIPTKVVLTKIDKLSPTEAGAIFSQIHDEVRPYLNCILPVRPVSSVKNMGLDELRAEIQLSIGKTLVVPSLETNVDVN